MAGAYKRETDRERGAKGKWTAFWIGADGKKKTRVGTTSKQATEEIARARELEAKQIREGVVDPADRTRREASLKAVADHAEDYRLSLLAKGDEPKHAAHVKGAIIRLFADASVTSVGSIRPDQLQAALGRLKVQRSARTCNHALAAVKAFANWLYDSERIQEVPRGLKKIRPYTEANDRRVIRRPLSLGELAKLLEATEAGPEIVTQRWSRGGGVKTRMTGEERAWAYRVAMATGFRANEIRSLRPESFALEGPSPTITVAASASKRGKRTGKDDVQPIARKDAEALRVWLATRMEDGPVFPLPEKTAEMLAADLARAGIEAKDAKGRVLDFHALRHTFITALVMGGANPKVAQSLARHSTIALTLDRYTHLEDGAEPRGAGGHIMNPSFEPSEDEKAEIEQRKRETRDRNFAALMEARKPKSKVKGVTWSPRRECWRAQFMRNGIPYDLGEFRGEPEAISALEAARAGGPITRHKLKHGKNGKASTMPTQALISHLQPEPVAEPSSNGKVVDIVHAKRWSSPPEPEVAEPAPEQEPEEQPQEDTSDVIFLADPLDSFIIELEATRAVVETLRSHTPALCRTVLESILARLP